MRSCLKRFPNSTKSGVTVRVQRGAGVAAAFPDDQYEAAGAALVDDAGALVSDADLVVTVGRPSDDVLSKMRRGAVLTGFFNPLGDPEYVKRLPARAHGACDGGDSAHHARAGDGRALVAKQHRRLQGGADRGDRAAEVLSDADDRRRNDPAGQGAGPRRRRRRTASDRDRAPPRRGRHRLRHARRRQGASAVAGRDVPRVRPRRRRRRRRRLCQRADARAARAPARLDGRADRRRRRRDHDRARARAPRADPRSPKRPSRR